MILSSKRERYVCEIESVARRVLSTLPLSQRTSSSPFTLFGYLFKWKSLNEVRAFIWKCCMNWTGVAFLYLKCVRCDIFSPFLRISLWLTCPVYDKLTGNSRKIHINKPRAKKSEKIMSSRWTWTMDTEMSWARQKKTKSDPNLSI